MKRLATLLFTLALVTASPLSHAWSRPGHMITAAMAYDDLISHDLDVILQITEIMGKHPDRGAFEVAMGTATGDMRARRLFMQMARWPDDVRTTLFDQPTWHYSGKPLIDARQPPKVAPHDHLSGAALEAFALNLKVARDRSAPAAQRAVALCWVFHILGDLHQPLHAADQFAARFPEGDRGGGLQFVRESATSEPETLHRFWDGIVPGTGEAADALNLARILATRYPRAALPQVIEHSSNPTDVATWTRESVEIASRLAYRSDVVTGTSAEESRVLPTAYVTEARAAGEARIAAAGYRLSDLLRAIFP